MIGLTATPANFIDRVTFRVFNCDPNAPTFLYEFDQAVCGELLISPESAIRHTQVRNVGPQRFST